MRNIVLITIDSLRYDAISDEYTPFISRLKDKGLFFERAYSLSSWTSPSVVGMLTSTYPLMYGGDLRIRYPRVSVAEILKSEGYATLGFTFHPYLDNKYGFGRGFDVYYDEIRASDLEGMSNSSQSKIVGVIKKVYDSKLMPKMLRNYIWLRMLYRRIVNRKLPYVPGFEINTMVKDHLEDIEEPFFLWVHYLDTHFPYVPLESDKSMDRIAKVNVEREKWFKFGRSIDKHILNELKELYLIKTKEVDKYVGDLVNYFKEIGLYKDTIFVITSDHGEEFYEHGGFHHEMKLYEELIHVPLVIIGNKLKSKVISANVSHIDLFPTIFDILGIPKPREWIGKNMLLNKSHIVFSEEGQKHYGSAFVDHTVRLDISFAKIAILFDEWKYIRGSDSEELYNLERDPTESLDLAGNSEYGNILDAFRNLYKRHLETVKTATPEKFIVSRVVKKRIVKYDRPVEKGFENNKL
ncbi:sulfatase [Geoglobus ahangari]